MTSQGTTHIALITLHAQMWTTSYQGRFPGLRYLLHDQIEEIPSYCDDLMMMQKGGSVVVRFTGTRVLLFGDQLWRNPHVSAVVRCTVVMS